ncbi:MAG: hypothetical protein LBG80_17045 [Bacteroidales bacterium]|jgi:hypothetical protein|nr:hypothetical protein [Bacteroidales bacterium]
MEKFYKILVRSFLWLGIIALITVFFGAIHQLIMAFVCFIIYALLKSELREKEDAEK